MRHLVQRPVWIWLDFISGHLYGSGIAGALLHATLADQQFNFTGSGFAVRLLLEYFFYYAMWGYENSSQILLRHMLPNLLCTLLVTPLIFLAVRRMHRFFEEKLE